MELDFTEISKGLVAVRNKPGRVKGIIGTIDGVLKRGRPWFGFKVALSLCSRIGYAESPTYGRTLAPLGKLLSLWASDGGRKPVTEELACALEFAKRHLSSAGPKMLKPRDSSKPVLVFTDGACEDEGTTI